MSKNIRSDSKTKLDASTQASQLAAILWGAENEEIKKKLLEAALTEFAEKGYALGSTNQVVQRAGVSKGMLFHFFSNKKNLYLYIVDTCIDYFQRYLTDELQDDSSDLLQRVVDLSMAKMKLFIEEPLIYQLAVTTFIQCPAEVKEEIREREKQVHATYLALLIKGIDASAFREGITPVKAAEFLIAAVEALLQKQIRAHEEKEDKGLETLQPFLEELSGYMEIVRHGVYR
ncbi:TetR/AcrR family transcriptional regulator [Brevibacillus ruminantium]|uniref:TetR/AcrR family transcriptional regulator n=1 Tax=Brevibacillus ruminantium TaxID=2950604 RepID=A0ABY4WLF1_9BACL|nr:TetR/AcrR family transcriptional regulator [Brevibacillus ruminantium]USG66887.1 TetR/AcrR family transcriptional regulator [Brevibacillus ruminantium]